ncbi:GAF and ANTAR domain-containing protein [Mycobacterium sp. SMC-4]|uniref:GAF and ANTAR domain-containing protein n=1 Tax=Mycobacterium sp. SMC-4 TaxID=2857059 RepID=UPI0021B3A7F3|nr:GAF and ANTAR domain-containing protein [Mycobacterium sp. SMC-4]UXA19272.1 GAF and ANTAR domain-containing protein [Mycobacterium sp. SMC-4]
MPDSQSRPKLFELAALVTDIQQRSMNTEAGLTELVDSATRMVPGAQYAAITLVRESSQVSTLAATHRYPAILDEIQHRHQDGPCLSAAWEHFIVRADDLSTEQRWPHYCREAIARTPVRSVISFEIFVNETMLGALNFYAEQPRVFGAEAQENGMVVATNIALAWAMLRREEEFRSALASRDLIGQAKGVIMQRFGIDAVQAFELLRRLSQDANVKLVEVARRLLTADFPPADG